jgi:DNA modification methylase
MHSYIGDVVLDPFNGSGTTTSVANRLGRKWIGYDITDDYCQLAEERI